MAETSESKGMCCVTTCRLAISGMRMDCPIHFLFVGCVTCRSGLLSVLSAL